MKPVNFVIFGEPASKANSRQIVMIKKRPAVIKSKKAREYVKVFSAQCMVLPEDEIFKNDVYVKIKIFYASRRPDLDASVVLDCMQGRIYVNDRQVKEMHLFHDIDREHPRAEIEVGEIIVQKNNN